MNGKTHGLVIGLVVDVEDPEGLGRIKVKFPWLPREPHSAWARVAAPFAGPELGIFFHPELDAEALVAFEQGDWSKPYIVGFVWGAENAIPSEEREQRIIKTTKGHTIVLDDRDGEESILIQDSNGNKVLMEDGGITIESEGDIKIKGKNIEIEASSQLTAVGDPIHLNP